MEKQFRFIILLCLSIFLAACSSIPENGSALNENISAGIAKNQIETEKIITALADVQRAVLAEKWPAIYKDAEDKYMAQHNITSASALSHEDRRRIATIAAIVSDDLTKEISAIEQSLIAETRGNSQTLIEMNDEVTKYLASLEELNQARQAISEKITDVFGVDFSRTLSKLDVVADKIDNLGK